MSTAIERMFSFHITIHLIDVLEQATTHWWENEVYMKKTPVPPSVLKQKARQLQKEKSISLAKAYEEVAKQFGYANYKNYLNEQDGQEAKTLKLLPDAKWIPDSELCEVDFAKMEKVAVRLGDTISRIKKSNLSMHELLDELERAQPSKEAVQFVCEKHLLLKEFVDLHLLRSALDDEGGEIDDYARLHMVETVTLKNLVFSFGDDVPNYIDGDGKLCVEGDYDIKLVFAHDYDPGSDHDIVKDDKMFGSFEITVDRDKNVIFENIDIGWYL